MRRTFSPRFSFFSYILRSLSCLSYIFPCTFRRFSSPTEFCWSEFSCQMKRRCGRKTCSRSCSSSKLARKFLQKTYAFMTLADQARLCNEEEGYFAFNVCFFVPLILVLCRFAAYEIGCCLIPPCTAQCLLEFVA